MTFCKGVAIVAVVALLAGTVWSAEETRDRKIKVQVMVNGDNDVKGALAGLLQEEFKGLSDVELVNEKPAWVLEVLGMAPRNEKKEPLVFLVSVTANQRISTERWHAVYETVAEAILRRQFELKDKTGKPYSLDRKKLAELRSAWTDGSFRAPLDTATENLVRPYAHYLKGGKDLRVLAKDIVDTFNKTQLSTERKK